jgi:hypothetical protein
MSQYNFDILHIKGKENIVADALSRLPSITDIENELICSTSHTLGL